MGQDTPDGIASLLPPNVLILNNTYETVLIDAMNYQIDNVQKSDDAFRDDMVPLCTQWDMPDDVADVHCKPHPID